MPRARQTCFRSGCPRIVAKAGACAEHAPKRVDTRQPWSNTSKRNQARSAGWTSLRLRILRRDAYTCYRCGSPKASEVDHVVSVAAGGSDDPLNLAAICRSCHRAKTLNEAQAGRSRNRHH
ncbi:HNH endonuclease signature motif containing protein [Streptomyces sp. NPDC051162]|uniref:HNH endonuclease n=1 Tax=Streptomyces sp. NPDC051162 TaxID=3154747 RepID=UPI00343DE562